MESHPLQDDREARIAELEGRLARQSGVGVKAPVAAVAVALCLGLLWYERLDLAYYVGSRDPIGLGAEGDYHFERLSSNHYAQIHGTPTTRGAYSSERGQTYVAVGLRDTPVLVYRPALPGEAPPRQPGQTPFAVRGRLLSQPDAERYSDAFKLLGEAGEVRPRDGLLWVLVEGERPGADTLTAALAAAVGAFALLNGWFFARDVRHRLRALRRGPPEAQSPKA